MRPEGIKDILKFFDNVIKETLRITCALGSSHISLSIENFDINSIIEVNINERVFLVELKNQSIYSSTATNDKERSRADIYVIKLNQ